ncbi:MAG: hypothetical protein ACRDXD_04725 [Acidimicrobiia bacterium]
MDDEIIELVERLRRELKAEARRLIRRAWAELPASDRRRLLKPAGDRQQYEAGKRKAEELFGGEAA